MDNSLTVRYRPQEFTEMIGNETLIESLHTALEKELSHSFLFVGPSGVGKTTAARITGDYLGAEVVEFDAATHTGIDAMRNILTLAQFKPFGFKARVIIIDEAHALSQAAWTSMLKSVEEPPEGVYWIFCTTNESKVPPHIRTRCHTLTFKEIDVKELEMLLLNVCESEEHVLSKQILQEIAYESNGSAREALSNLSLCWEVKDVSEVKTLIGKIEPDDDAVAILCKKIMKNVLLWEDVQEMYKAVVPSSPELVRRQICGYLTKVTLTNTNEELLMRCLTALEHLTESCDTGEWAPLVLGLAHIVYDQDQTDEGGVSDEDV